MRSIKWRKWYWAVSWPLEELNELIPLKGQTQAHICEAIIGCLQAKGIKPSYFVLVSTDEASNIRWSRKSLVNWLQNSLDRELITLHSSSRSSMCLDISFWMCRCNESAHQNSEQDNCKQSCSLLEIDNTYSDLLLHYRIRWLSGGEVLK